MERAKREFAMRGKFKAVLKVYLDTGPEGKLCFENGM